ncbi:MAG: translesion DNA synthesis-associated protein ImuA [Gammaproteobacteria bacterium]
MKKNLENLLSHPGIWRGQTDPKRRTAFPSGHARLDEMLPGGGWPDASLIEILVEHHGTGELQLLLPLLEKLSQKDDTQQSPKGWLCWIAPPYIPNAPALLAGGVDISRVLLVHARDDREALWAMDQAMRSGGCELVLGWVRQTKGQQLRCLQLAAEEGNTTGILFRPSSAIGESSAASLRLMLSPGSDGRIDIIKNRGGRPASLPIQDVIKSPGV